MVKPKPILIIVTKHDDYFVAKALGKSGYTIYEATKSDPEKAARACLNWLNYTGNYRIQKIHKNESHIILEDNL